MSNEKLQPEFHFHNRMSYVDILSNYDTTDSWERSIEEYKKDNNRPVICLESKNTYDEGILAIAGISIPQAKFLIDTLIEIVEHFDKQD